MASIFHIICTFTTSNLNEIKNLYRDEIHSIKP